MQELAPPGGVIIAEGTKRLIGDLFELSDLCAVQVKSFAAPVPVWQAVRPSPVESRFEALRARDLTPLVGALSRRRDRLAVDRAVDDQMGNMNILPPELARHRLCHGGGRTLAHTGVDEVAQFSGNPSEFAAPIRSRRLLTALA